MKKQIYVADDNKNIRDILTSFLQDANFEVDAFSTWDALFEAFQKAL